MSSQWWRKGRFLGIVAATAIMAFVAGLVVGKLFPSPGWALHPSRWARFEMARTATLWGFRYAGATEAEKLLTLQVGALEQCNARNSAGYPCRGKARIETYMMLASLKEDAGDGNASEAWVAKAVSECVVSTGADCNIETVRRGVERLRALRKESTNFGK
jgi:hypothetical protein